MARPTCALRLTLGIVARMSDAIHLQIYRRFFAVLLSVVPGLNLVLGLAALVLWLFADVIEADWGFSVGLGAVTFAIAFVAWIFVGLGVQKWAEHKSAGLLIGLCAPFLAVDFVFMDWLLYSVLVGDREEEAARWVIQTLSMLA